MKRLFILLFLFAGYALSQTNVSGTINENTTWDLAGSPYIVTANVTVNSAYTLTINSDVEVKFESGTSLIVYGTLDATGVTFTSNQSSPQKGDWNYIQIGYSSYSGTATFDQCTIEFGGGNSSYPGMIYVYRGSADIVNSDISQSGNDGLLLYQNATVTLTGSNIFSCNWPVRYRGPAELSFSGSNNLSGNTHDGIYMNFTSHSNALTLNYINIPYVFLNSFTTYSGGTLTIASENILKFDRYDGLYIEGTLIAEAAEGESIIFTSYRNDNAGGDTNADGTATAPASSDWAAVYFRDSSNDAACLMRRCEVTFAGSGSIGGISIENASPTIDLSNMANNYYGAMIKGVSNPVFSNNTIGSSQIVPIAMSFDAFPEFTNNSFSFSDNEYDAIGLLGGTLGADAVLPIRNVTDIPNVTYLMLGALTIPEGLTLTINKGIVIKGYSSYHRIYVKGKLVADATADSMITFTSAKDDNFGNPLDTNKDGTQSSPSVGDWGGIMFEKTSDPASILNYCRFKYAEMPSTYYNTRYIYDGAISMENASPTISNCEINHAVYGIYAFQSSNPQISNNQIINTSKTPIALSVSADPFFSGNSFTNTKWTALGIIGEEVGANGTIEKLTVAGYSNITYILLEDLTVNSGTNVNVDPGVIIKCNNNAGIFVNGGFKAQGTAGGEEIVFTSIKDDNYGNPNDTNGDGNASSPASGDWETIHFKESSDDGYCLLDHCFILYPGSSGYTGAVTFTDASGTVSNSIISDSYYYALRCEGSSAPIVSNVEIKNTRLDPIAMSLKSDPTFTDIVFTGNGSNGIRILEGTLSSDATLAQRDVAGIENIAYIVDQLTIAADATLTINPGVVIKFSNYYDYIRVEGALIAEGTSEEKIVFTSLKDDSEGGDTNTDGNASTASRGDWWSIVFYESSLEAQNVLKHCILRYGGRDQSGWSDLKDYGALRLFNVYALIENCTIEQSSTTGIGIYGSADPLIKNNEILNITRTPISMSMFANPTFQNNTALNLGQHAIGIASENYSVSATVPKRDFAGHTNITYFIFSECTINTGTTITVPAGVVFKSPNVNMLEVSGGLVINGTDANPVVFTNEHDDDYGNPKDTNGDGSTSSPSISSYYALQFTDVSSDAASTINHAVFRYHDRGIDLQQASPTITNSYFDQNNWGIILDGVSNPVVENCTFNDLSFTPIKISLVSYPATTSGNVISGSTYRAIGVLGETLAQDVTLINHNFAGIDSIPYYFHEDYTIGTSVVLTISPGVICKFAEYVNLEVRKGLIAEGGADPDSIIVFTSILDDFYGGDTNADSNMTTPSINDGWDGVDFSDESLDPFCLLDYCVFKYAGRYSNDGAIYATSASPTITHSLFTQNRNGIIAKAASNPLINHCDIYENSELGVDNVDQSFVIDARYNWWGHNSGPTHTSNPGGEGQEISDAVDYGDFFTSGAMNPMMGDVSLNGIVQAFDASLILQNVVGSYSFNDRQLRVADVSGNGSVQAYDASLVLQYIVELISAFPAGIELLDPDDPLIAETLRKLAQQSEPEARLSVGSAKIKYGEQFRLPLSLHNTDGLFALQATLSYDPQLITFESFETSGSNSEYQLVCESVPEQGKLHLAIAGGEELEFEGDFISLRFIASEDVRDNEKLPVKVENFVANESNLTKDAQSGFVEIQGKPSHYALSQNYPNPFNGTTVINYQIPDDNTHVRIAIYDLLGRRIRTLVDAGKDAGNFSVIWDGKNDLGISVASGTYLYQIHTEKYTRTKRLQYLK